MAVSNINQLPRYIFSDSRFTQLMQNLVSSIFNAESFNLNMVKSIHKEIDEFAKTNNIHLPYDILKVIADSYEAVAEKSHQLDANSKLEAYESALNIYAGIASSRTIKRSMQMLNSRLAIYQANL